MNASVDSVVASAGLTIIPLPAASEAAACPGQQQEGKIERHDVYTHPIGLVPAILE
jgi:hypothetical protein